jgi:ABC-type multidrug transport system ATPase subunit
MAGEGTTVIFSTHNAAEAQRHAGRLLVLDRGRALFDGTPQALIAEMAVGEDLERALVRFLELQETRSAR